MSNGYPDPWACVVVLPLNDAARSSACSGIAQSKIDCCVRLIRKLRDISPYFQIGRNRYKSGNFRNTAHTPYAR